VAALSVPLKTALQTAALTAQTEAARDGGEGEGSTAGPGGAATAAEGSKAGKGGKEGKGKKKRGARIGGGGSGDLNAEDTISLSTDFSSFGKKK